MRPTGIKATELCSRYYKALSSRGLWRIMPP